MAIFVELLGCDNSRSSTNVEKKDLLDIQSPLDTILLDSKKNDKREKSSYYSET